MTNQPNRQSDGFAGTHLSIDAAARLVANICELTQLRLPEEHCSVTTLTRIFDMGIEVFEDSSSSVPFADAIAQFVQSKQELRPASFGEYRAVMGRLIRLSPHMADRSVRSLRTRDCLEMMDKAFSTPHTLDKARRLLHCFFSYSLQQNWCRENPISRIQVYRKKEGEISALSLEQINRLLTTAALPEHIECAPAVGLMLWSGLRPTEVTRLRWSEIDLEDNVVRVLPRVSKTGGARLVSIQPVLRRWLERFRPDTSPEARVLPASWIHRWYALRTAAGLLPWQSDTLRHTFASYHLRYFKNIHLLQMEMGHSTARLLFNRYLNLTYIRTEDAAEFWGLPLPPRPRIPRPCSKAAKRAAKREEELSSRRRGRRRRRDSSS